MGTRTYLGVVLAVGLLARLAAFASTEAPSGYFYPPDSFGYDRLGWNLAAHGCYSLAAEPPGEPDLTRTPAYPLLVACCYRLAGHRPAVVIAAQVVLAVLTLFVVDRAGDRVAGARAGLLAAGLLALDPLSTRYATHLLSETLFTLLFTGSLACLLAYLRHPNPAWAGGAALLAGVAILCRPIAVLWPPAVALLFVLVAWRGRSWRPLAHLLLFEGLTLAVVAPWVLRNQALTGRPFLTTVQGINLYYHRAARVVAVQEGISLESARERLRQRLEQAVQDNPDGRRKDALMEAWGAAIIRSSPGTYLLVHAQGAVRMFAPHDRPAPLLGLPPSLLWGAEAAFLTLLYGSALVGLVTGLGGPGRLPFLLLGLAILYFVGLSGPEAYARFRVPLMPVLALLAGAGLASFRPTALARRRDGGVPRPVLPGGQTP